MLKFTWYNLKLSKFSLRFAGQRGSGGLTRRRRGGLGGCGDGRWREGRSYDLLLTTVLTWGGGVGRGGRGGEGWGGGGGGGGWLTRFYFIFFKFVSFLLFIWPLTTFRTVLHFALLLCLLAGCATRRWAGSVWKLLFAQCCCCCCCCWWWERSCWAKAGWFLSRHSDCHVLQVDLLPWHVLHKKTWTQ